MRFPILSSNLESCKKLKSNPPELEMTFKPDWKSQNAIEKRKSVREVVCWYTGND